MKLNLGFSVIANCVTLEQPDDNQNNLSSEILLHFDIETAMNFVARFGPDSIELEVGEDHLDGKIVFSRKASDPDYIAILLLVDGETFIVKNPHQILRDTFEGYNKLVALSKISSIIDFDFDAGLEFQE